MSATIETSPINRQYLVINICIVSLATLLAGIFFRGLDTLEGLLVFETILRSILSFAAVVLQALHDQDIDVDDWSSVLNLIYKSFLHFEHWMGTVSG